MMSKELFLKKIKVKLLIFNLFFFLTHIICHIILKIIDTDTWFESDGGFFGGGATPRGGEKNVQKSFLMRERSERESNRERVVRSVSWEWEWMYKKIWILNIGKKSLKDQKSFFSFSSYSSLKHRQSDTYSVTLSHSFAYTLSTRRHKAGRGRLKGCFFSFRVL